ncbi:MAG: GtrA family protein [Spirochaetes bacterium]|nr:GtrA family protein [Spirochaetota bacterium]
MNKKNLLINKHKHEIVKIFRFCIVGFANTAVFSLLFYVLFNLLEVNYLIATTLSYFIATLNSFFLNRNWTFKQKSGNLSKLPKFILLNIFSASINSLSMFILVDHLHFPVWPSQVLTICLTLIINYTVNRFYIFKTNHSMGYYEK